MLKNDSVLYFATVNCTHEKLNAYWDKLYPTLGPNAQLWLDMGKYLGKNRCINRHGEWTAPWPTAVVPGFEMPAYDPKFNLSFEQVTDQRALDIQKIIHKTDARIGVFYSGGIDSTICLSALIKNLSSEELKHIDVCLSAESIIENPHFFEKFIHNKINIIDSSKVRYDYFESRGNYTITSDQGDSIFGTELGTKLYFSYPQVLKKLSQESRKNIESLGLKISDGDVHYSKYKDLIIAYFDLPHRPDFGRQFYEKLNLNIQSSAVPIVSLHDFFWWYIFNVKYMECALRSTIYYYSGQEIKKSITNTVINWFNDPQYQKWSMANNNNGQKINGTTPASYKLIGRKYIYNFDKNDWYFKYKSKLASLINITSRNKDVMLNRNVFCLDKDYVVHYFSDTPVRLYVEEKLKLFN